MPFLFKSLALPPLWLGVLFVFGAALVSFRRLVVEGAYSNTVLYPVSEDARAKNSALSAAAEGSSNNARPRIPGAPSRYLEYEGPDATYNIRLGTHPYISYPDLEDFPDTEIRVRYEYDRILETSKMKTNLQHRLVTTKSSHKKESAHKKPDSQPYGLQALKEKEKKKQSSHGILQVDDCPRHFLWLSDKAVQKELDHRLQTGRWSERVLVEKTYFTLFYGGTGLASQYMDSVDDFQTDLKGWEIMNRSSDHCKWEGIRCERHVVTTVEEPNTKNITATNATFSKTTTTKKITTKDVVTTYRINGFSLEGSLPHDLYQLSHLAHLDLKGNRIRGTIPSSWGNMRNLVSIDLRDNRLTGTLPSTLSQWRNIQHIFLGQNRLEGSISTHLMRSWLDMEGRAIVNMTGVGVYARPSLSYLNVSHNRFHGRFPFEILLKYGKYLGNVAISGNQFTGSVPNYIVLDPSFLQEELKSIQNALNDGNYSEHRQLKQLLTRNQRNHDDNGLFPFLQDVVVSHCREVHMVDQETIVGKDRSEPTVTAGKSSPKTLSHEYSSEAIDSFEESFQQCIHDRWLNLFEISTTHRRRYYAGLERLSFFDVSQNALWGSLPDKWMEGLSSLKTLNFSNNRFTGSLPRGIWKAWLLQEFKVSHNKLVGEIPHRIATSAGPGFSSPYDPFFFDNPEPNTGWSDLRFLTTLHLDHNRIQGTIPNELFSGLSNKLSELNLGANALYGTIPSVLGEMSMLESLDLHANQLTGRLPAEMNRLYPAIKLNLTDNLLTGSVPRTFCGSGMNADLLVAEFGCDAILCPAGTFHPNGAASLYAGCRPCPVEDGDDPMTTRKLGAVRCGTEKESYNRAAFIQGDLNGDGELSEREVLRLLYTYTIGKNWGLQFSAWGNPKVNKCDLHGVSCVGGNVTRIDLTDASVCMSSDPNLNYPFEDCNGIPSELSKLSYLEILTMNRRQYLKGTLPTEIGKLTALKYIDISSCPMMAGELPSEIGKLTNLKYLNLGGCRFNGTIPEEIFKLSSLEKLHLSLNAFTGSLPSSLEEMASLKEFLLSRTFVNGTIPENIGDLSRLENFEMYGNQLTGTIPNSLGRCGNLKRIDLFNNKLTGTIPESLSDIKALQILHIKLNHLTGTISSGFGLLPHLSWFDVSSNRLHGTIPESFGDSKTLKDFRLGGGNMIHDPVPKSLCLNTNINGGLTKLYGCGGVICPLGTYSDPGHATHSDGCKRCPNGRTTIYLGSSRCMELTDESILSMFYDVMASTNGFRLQQMHWGSDRDGHVCTWNGIECDENGVIESIWFPLLGLNAEAHH